MSRKSKKLLKLLNIKTSIMGYNEYEEFEKKRLNRLKGLLNFAIIACLVAAVLQYVLGDGNASWSRGVSSFSYKVDTNYFLMVAVAIWLYKLYVVWINRKD